jgi:hypothetical protein
VKQGTNKVKKTKRRLHSQTDLNLKQQFERKTGIKLDGSHKPVIGPWDDPWLLAIKSADTWRDPDLPKNDVSKSDLRQLIELLRSDTELTREARDHFADLLGRHQLKSKPGGQQRPGYAGKSRAEEDIELQVELYHEMHNPKIRRSDQIAGMVQHFRLYHETTDPKINTDDQIAADEQKMANALDGKRGSSRRGRPG